jgi:integrase
MARPLELKPYRLPNGRWHVNVIAALSPDGKRKRPVFKSRQAALAYIEELKARRDNLAVSGRTLSPAELLDAAAALDLLEAHPSVSLSEAVTAYLELRAVRTASVTVAELCATFSEAKKHRSRSYQRDIRWASDHLKPLAGKLVSDVTRSDIASALAGFPASSRNNILRTLRAMFRYGHDLGYLKAVPIRKSDFSEIKRTQIDVLAVGKIRELLETTLLHDPALLPLLLLEVFCGIRPAEAARVLWTDIDLLRKEVVVRALVSKTGTARVIQIAPCALAWFQAYAATKGVVTTGPVCPWTESVLRSRLRRLRFRAGYQGEESWTTGSLRDAFCSYHLAHYGSIDRLITEAGHTSLRTTKDHYLGLVSKQTAAEFWDLFPPAEGKKKVIPFMPRVAV